MGKIIVSERLRGYDLLLCFDKYGNVTKCMKTGFRGIHLLWTGLIWHGIGLNNEFVCKSQTSWFHIRREISLLADRLSDFQEVLYFMKLFGVLRCGWNLNTK
jgi:hypothetical protein